jgi:hypothetical protein
MTKSQKIVWLRLNGDQECSYRLGFDDRKEKLDMSSVGCIEAYNIAWDAVKKMVKAWNYIDRPPHYDEISAYWYENEKLEHPLRNCYQFKDIVREAKLKIRKLYLSALNREPNHNEMMGAFRQCFINQDFSYNWKIKSRKKNGNCTKNYLRINHDNRARKDMVKLANLLTVGNCVFCGEPVMAYDAHFLKNAGTIEMSFGYGSHRDTHFAKGHIHDMCSARLDQIVMKSRMDWGEHDNKYKVDLKRSRNGKLVIVKKKEKQPRLQF